MQFYPNFALFSTLGGMNLDQDFFQVSKFSEDQKKGLLLKWITFFPRIQVQICAQVHTRVKLLEGMQMKTILKLLGGIQSNYWGGYIPLSPRVSAPLAPLKLPFSLRQFKTVAFVFLGPTENSQKSRPIWRVDLFFEISRELEVKQTTPIWRDSLSFFFFFEINGELGVM